MKRKDKDRQEQASSEDDTPCRKHRHRSIREVLTKPMPTPDVTERCTHQVTTNQAYTDLLGPSALEDWVDFRVEVLSSAYFDLLEEEDEFEDGQHWCSSQEKTVTDEASFQNFAKSCCASTLYKPLKTGASKLAEILGYPEEQFKSIFFRSFGETVTSEQGTRLKPDWYIDLTKITPVRHLVVGETKCTTAWKLEDRPTDNFALDTRTWMWPWRQITSYCRSINSRHGFLLVPEGLIAVLVYKDEGDVGGLPYRIKYKFVPWEASGEDQMTVNLGIFFIAMMAMHDVHRPIVTRSKVLPLNVWWQDGSGDDAKYEHHLSGRVVDELPDGAQAMPRPTAALEDSVPEKPARKLRKKRV